MQNLPWILLVIYCGYVVWQILNRKFPGPPTRSCKGNFASKADEFIKAQEKFVRTEKDV